MPVKPLFHAALIQDVTDDPDGSADHKKGIERFQFHKLLYLGWTEADARSTATLSGIVS